MTIPKQNNTFRVVHAARGSFRTEPDHFGRGDVRPVDSKQRQLLETYLLGRGK